MIKVEFKLEELSERALTLLKEFSPVAINVDVLIPVTFILIPVALIAPLEILVATRLLRVCLFLEY